MGIGAPLPFLWTDLSEQDILLLSKNDMSLPLAETLLHKAANHDESTSHLQQAVELALYKQTLQQAQELHFNGKQSSAMFSIVKALHRTATSKHLTIDRAFECFKQLLLRHSVHRPPFSLGLYTLPQAQALTRWMLNTYFMHYKLYQYAFTARITCTVQTCHPGDIVELPPQLSPLQEAATQEEHDSMLQQQQQQEVEAAAKKAQETAAQEEADRQKRIKDSYDAVVPDEIQQRVQAALQKEMEHLQIVMSAQFAKQEAALTNKVAELEAKAAATGVA